MANHSSMHPVAVELQSLIQQVAESLESASAEKLAVSQKRLQTVVNLLITCRRSGLSLPPATIAEIHRMNSLRRQADALISQSAEGVTGMTPTYAPDGAARMTMRESGGFEMEF